MDVDDEFGDIYADMGPEIGKNIGTDPSVGEGDLDDEELLYGTSSSSSSLAALSSKPPLSSTGIPRRSGIQLALAPKEVDHDELLLYGQLYGVPVEKPVKADSPFHGVEIQASSVSRQAKRQDSREESRSLEIPDESNFDLLVEDRTNKPGKVLRSSGDIPLGAVGTPASSAERALEEKDSASFQGQMLEGFRNLGLPSDKESLSLNEELHVSEATREMNSSPGRSGSVRLEQVFVNEKETAGQEAQEEWDGGFNEGVEEHVEGDEDWDSDSEDDIHIVLTSMYAGEKPADGDEDERSEDEDEEDLVIVTGDDDALPIEDQEWEEQPVPLDPLPGASGATLSLGSDRAPGGEDKGQGGKGSGGPGTSSGVPHIRYSGQGYHTHHMQYKYVRPGARDSSGLAPPSSQGSPQAGVSSSGRGTSGGSLAGWGSGRGVAGRGDWVGSAGRGSTGQRSSQGSSVMPSWGASRGFTSGVEFNLPPTKTVFDVDLDSLEEKPWRRPGVDITDYFNFSFTESSWKQYCRQLAQLRLEATMQSKIRVYESGRSEQEYDPDLPPELAAATGMQEASADTNLLQQRQQDIGSGAVPGPGRGRGLGRGRMMPPTGRAIQVEGGGGERRPSADVRRQRSRDSDAIVLQDASEDEPPVSVSVNEGNEESQEDDEDRGVAVSEKERRFFRPWEMEGPPNIWERDNMMPMGLGPMPNMMGSHGGVLMPGHRMDVDGPGSFPIGPGMPILQPGLNPNFGMFAGAPFPPPAGRAGVVRPPLYSAPRPALSLQVSAPLPEVFPPMMVPLDYQEPTHRRTPPHLTLPRRTPPQDWDDEVSNGSGADWNSREGRNHRASKDSHGGHGDWRTSETERWERNHPVRRGREIDQLPPREKSMDEASTEGRSEERSRSLPREFQQEDNNWDGVHGHRIAKKQKVQPQVDTRVKPGKEDSNNLKILKSNVRKADSPHSWEPAKERVLQEDDIMQPKRRDVFHSKASERKGHSLGEDSLSNQRNEFSWDDRQDGESKDRRQPREREETQRRKVKEDDTYQHRNREDLERDRRRDDQERERRHPKKGKDEDRAAQDERSRRHTEDHVWSSREREEARARDDVKSVSIDREPEHSKEKRRREDDRGKLKRRLEDYREADGRAKGRLEDLRESDGRGKGQLEERRDNDGRVRGRAEDIRDGDGRVKGRFEDVRGKERIEDVRESDGRGKGWLEDVKESDGRAKSRFEESRESEGRTKGRTEEFRDMDGRAKSRLEDGQESDGRGKFRLSNTRETDGRQKGWPEDLREGEGRMKPRLEGLREGEMRLKGRSDDFRESDGRIKGRLEDVKDGDGRSKGRLEGIRHNDARVKRRMDDLRDGDVRVKGRLDDFGESDAWGKGRPEDPRDTVGRGKVRLEEGRENDGRSRPKEKEDNMHTWDDQRKYEKSSRNESTHAVRNHSMESRKVTEEQRPHKEKRAWEGSLTAKETTSDRNGLLPGLGGDKIYRSHTDDSKKQRVEEYRTSAQFDKAATRDSDDSAATSTRHKEKRSLRKKAGQNSRKLLGKDTVSRQHRVSNDENVLAVGNGSSEEEADRRGRSKLERWTSRKEPDAMSAFGGGSLQTWPNSESALDEGPSTSQHHISEKKQPSQVEQHWKEGAKEKQRITKYSGKRSFESEQKELSATHGSDSGDAVMKLPTVVPKDASEKRRERLERLRLQAEEETAKRQKNAASAPQAGLGEEVKQERPARKRRWGNG
ncbi:unnamed protein product [Calypogeia fissa]